jgi:hypothetical protein
MTMVYAVEGWILAIMGWGWLVVQEMWAWSLLSAHVFYGLIWLSTCNVVAVGVAPSSRGPRSAYFSAVLILFLHTLCAVLDTLATPQILSVFESPFKATCSLARIQQLYFFSSSPFYLAQAGATLGYLVIQLVIAGAAMLSVEGQTVWPGTAWSLGLGFMLSARLVTTFDGTAKGALAGQGKFVELFSLPVVEFTAMFAGFMYLQGVLLGVEGLSYPGLGWRKTMRYVSFAVVMVFFWFSFYALAAKGILTPWLAAVLVIMAIVSILSLVEAVRAQAPLPMPANVPVFQSYAPPAQPSAPYGLQPAMGMQGRARLVIPSAVEMPVEKNKGV